MHANGIADAKALESLNNPDSLNEYDESTVRVKAPRTDTPPLNTVAAALAEHGASQYPTPSTPPRVANLFLETGHLSASPQHSPHIEPTQPVEEKVDENVPSKVNGDLAASQSSAGTDPSPRDFANEAARPSPSRSQTHSSYQYPSTALLHPSSAAVTPTTASSAPTAFKDIVAAATGASVSRPSRRNTTGSSTNPPSKPNRASAGAGSSAGGVPIAASTSGIGASGSTAGMIHDHWDPELDEDMKKQAEQIRRERKRRDLEAQEAERIKEEGGPAAGKRDSKGKEKGHARSGSAGAKSTGGRSGGGKSLDEWRPIVGNVVGEGHVNYVLMYNMLTGIRVAVSFVASGLNALTDDYCFRFRDVRPSLLECLRMLIIRRRTSTISMWLEMK